MSSRQTRSQASQAGKVETASSDAPSDAVTNGNGSAHHVSEASDSALDENIFLFWPNIIGYSRIVLAVASLYYMPLHPRTCSFLYSVSCLLDALDGYAARYFEQSTRFGALLDMVTDRCTTACLLVFLASAFPRYSILFQGLISLDLASHYMHMYTTLVVSGTESSHKNIEKSQSFILNLYYTNKIVLFLFCMFNELFFIALYLLSFSSPLLSPHLVKGLEETSGTEIQPGVQVNTSILRQIFPDTFSAAALELARANKMDSTVPWIIASISFPIMFGKQIINVIQMVKASKQLAVLDVNTRRENGLPRPKPKKA